MLPTDHKARKEFPLLTVLSAYFPDAIEALVELCKAGNVQHNVSADAVNPFALPEDRITWDRSKSTDQVETLARHTWDHMRAKRGVGSVIDTDGHLHIIKAFWRAGAEAQLTIEALRMNPCHGLGKPTTFLDIPYAGQGPEVSDGPESEGFAPGHEQRCAPGPDINGEVPTDTLPVMLADDVAQGWSKGMPVPKGRYVRPDGTLSTPADPLYRDLPTL